MIQYPEAFEKVLLYFSRFQGIGRKTAERLVFDMLTRWDERAVREFSESLQQLLSGIVVCPECRIHVEALPCRFCSQDRQKELCIVATSKDAYAIVRTGLYPGLYYVLGTTLSPLDDRGIDLEELKRRIEKHQVTEVIFAFDSSLEGDATVSFLKGELESSGVQMSRLAAGVPVGATLEFIDRGTLGRAFSGRQRLH